MYRKERVRVRDLRHDPRLTKREGKNADRDRDIRANAPWHAQLPHVLIAQTNVTRQEMHRPTECLLFIQAKRYRTEGQE